MFRKKPKEEKIIQVIEYKILKIDYEIVYKYVLESEPVQEFDRKETINEQTGTIIVDLYNDNKVNIF